MDRAGIERIERNAEREGVGSEEFEAVARGVFEFEGTEFGFDEIKERNWLIAQRKQITSLFFTSTKRLSTYPCSSSRDRTTSENPQSFSSTLVS